MRAVKKEGRWGAWGLVTLFILAGASRLPPEGATSSQAAEQQAALDKAVQVVAGKSHTCAITSSRLVMCWGDNTYGQLGDGSTAQRLAPVYVIDLSQGVVAITAGAAHTCAITHDAGVKCWGANDDGQLGDGSTSQHLAPVAVLGLSQDISAITAAGNHTCALSPTTGVKCWGQNAQGVLGDNTITNRLTPVSVADLGTEIRAVATSENHTCALSHAGGVKCWGYNGAGQLGDGSTLNRLSPVEVMGLTQGIGAIAVGGYHTCALTINSWVKCWGYNGYGQVGDNSNVNRAVAVDVAALSQGVIGLAVGKFHTCALDHRNSVKCWGRNVWGALGDGSKSDRSTPTDVWSLSQGIFAISAGDAHTCALTDGNGILCWGANEAGQLGNNSTEPQVTPVYVYGLEGKRKVYLAALMNQVIVMPDPFAPSPTLPDNDEPNNFITNTVEIKPNVRILATVNEKGDDRDYYRLALQAGKRYAVRLSFSGNADLDLYVYDSEYHEIVKSKNDGPVPEEAILQVSKEGVYYVLVSAFGSSGAQLYELIITE